MKVSYLIAIAAVGTQVMDAAPVGEFEPFGGELMDINPYEQYKKEAFNPYARTSSHHAPTVPSTNMQMVQKEQQEMARQHRKKLPTFVDFYSLMTLPKEERAKYELTPFHFLLPTYRLKEEYRN